ncbi:hypothetical protein N574_12360 [Lactiplantibacillus plantarum 2165]|nr:hypothetical protein N574_12360 [Lactiplantibacillus plantarum 2165]
MNSLPIVESMHIFKKDSSGSFIILKDRHWINTFLFEGSMKRFHWCIRTCLDTLTFDLILVKLDQKQEFLIHEKLCTPL